MTEGESGIRLGDGVYSAQLTAKLARVSLRQLRYWVRQGLLQPTAYDAPYRGRDLYSYTDVVQARVIGSLRRQGASLQKIRRAVEWLRAQMAAGEQWHTKRLVIYGNDLVVFLAPDEVYSAAGRPGQRVFEVFLREVTDEIANLGESLGLGRTITIDPAIHGGAPVIAHTRLPTKLIRQLLVDGYTPRALIASYPGLRLEDIRAADEFERQIAQVA